MSARIAASTVSLRKRSINSSSITPPPGKKLPVLRVVIPMFLAEVAKKRPFFIKTTSPLRSFPVLLQDLLLLPMPESH